MARLVSHTNMAQMMIRLVTSAGSANVAGVKSLAIQSPAAVIEQPMIGQSIFDLLSLVEKVEMQKPAA